MNYFLLLGWEGINAFSITITVYKVYDSMYSTRHEVDKLFKEWYHVECSVTASGTNKHSAILIITLALMRGNTC